MAIIAKTGYKVKGIDNVVVRFYPQVLGIQKVHEHNLCNALRDFGLMLKSDCKEELLRYNYDFLKFVHTMRSSELCMIAHGYSLLGLNDLKWWDAFTKVASKNSFDMDGKEMSGILYSLSKVYTGTHPLIAKLLEESKDWIPSASPNTLSLLIKVVVNLKIGDTYLEYINTRAMEIINELKMVDIIFFITANTDAKTRNLELYRTLCLRAIELFDEMELHHLRALAACLSIAGYKSHLFFNVLAFKLVDICRTRKISDGDLISLFLGYTSQKFLTQNDLCIDVQVYKRFLKKHVGQVSKGAFEFPLYDITIVLAEALEYNIHKITYHGMPIIIRAIAILRLPVSDELYNRIINVTSESVANGKYDALKLSNLVVTIAKRRQEHPEFWNAVIKAISAYGNDIDPDLLAKMTVTVSNCTNEDSRREVYRHLLKLSTECSGKMSLKSISAFTRALVANMEIDVLCSDAYINPLISRFENLMLHEIYGIIKSYPFRSVPSDNANVLRLTSVLRGILSKSERKTSCYGSLKGLLECCPYSSEPGE